MEGTWNVYFEDRPVGVCRVWREGLYFRFRCRCDRVAEGICRLHLQCGEENADLGVLIPGDGEMELDRKVPVRHLPSGEPWFCIKLRESRSDECFVPVGEGEPFAFLSRLEDVRFGKQGGIVGVFIKECY